MITNEGDGVQSGQTTLREQASSSPPPPPPLATSTIPIHRMSWYRKLWLKLRVSPRDLRNTIKMSLPSVICIASFQSDFIANYFTINGYINALIALCVIPTLPRARFVHVLVHTVFAICLAAALVCLALWSAIQARIHTINPALPPEKYNSSQAAILGVWLFFMIWAGSTVKSAYPLTMMPVLLFEIYAIVGCTSGANLENVSDALKFGNNLLVNFLYGLAVSTGVSLFIFPLSCRTVFFEAVTGYLTGIQKALKTQHAYLHSIQDQDPWRSDNRNLHNDALVAHRKTLDGLYGAAAKVRGELEYAAKEITFAKLDARQMSEISEWSLRIMPAFSGLGFIYDILDRLYDDTEGFGATPDQEKVVSEWQTIMQALYLPIVDLSTAMGLAIEHVLLSLQLKKPLPDEKNSQDPAPGSPEFLAWYNEQTLQFTQTRETVARLWFEKEGVKLPEGFLENGYRFDEKFKIDDRISPAHRKPFTIIYIQFLIYAASREILDLVMFVDTLMADGTLTKRRFIGPSFKHLQKWFASLLQSDDDSESKLSPQASVASYNGSEHLTPNPRKKVKNDPEHLPATRWWESVGNYIRLFSKLMRSAHATHGLRVACAVMSVAVGFYIKTSSTWFNMNRWLWAMFAIVLTMNRTAGLSLFLFFCRVGGTAVAMCASLAVYYMVVGHTVGALILLWVWAFILSHFMARLPFYMPAFMVTYMATIVMVGNELQDKKLGFARVTASGQAAHEEYLMAPERLAIVSAGIGIGFFWTIFPYPLSEHSELRQDLASTLYYLASHHSMIARTVSSRAKGLQIRMATRNDNDLARARMKSFTKLQFLFGRLRRHLKFTRYQVVLGGKFPTAQYAELISLSEKIFTASNVIGYASTSFVRAWENTHNSTSTGGQPRPESQWLSDFRSLLGTVDMVSEEVISTLVGLSNHMAAANPFPPFMKSPEVGKLAKMIDQIRGNMLTVSHITEPGYAAFVTMTMANRGINRALTRQLEICKELVGVLDFSSLVDVDIEDGAARLDDEEKAEEMGPTGFSSAFLR